MAADPKKQIRGMRSKVSGDAFERWLSSSCDYYKDLGIAFIEKTPEPMRPIRPYGDRKKGQYIACFVKCAQPDYKGILCDGTGIMFEAKHTDTGKMQQSAVTDTQWECLDTYQKFGAHCFVMVSMGLTSFYRVPWDVWKNMKQLFGHKYMTPEELHPYMLKEKQCVIQFLEGVELRDED